jgi:hypothetical protein
MVRVKGWLPADFADTTKWGSRPSQRQAPGPLSAELGTCRGRRNADSTFPERATTANKAFSCIIKAHSAQLCNKFESPDQKELWGI